MKKLLAIMLACALSIGGLCACSDSDEDKKATIEKYELVELELLELDADTYDYNYIEFNHKEGTYYLENKAFDVVASQSGTFTIDDDGNLTITNDEIPEQDFLLADGEKAYFKGDKLYLEGEIEGIGEVSMVYQK